MWNRKGDADGDAQANHSASTPEANVVRERGNPERTREIWRRKEA